jgi:hypothetical protein
MACQACHADFRSSHGLHGHSQALKVLDGTRPLYPADASRAGVPDPPPGFGWSDLRLAIGGYTKSASLVSSEGYLLTDELGGPPVQYILPFLVSQAPAGFLPANVIPVAATPYQYDCFRCHVTGPQSLAENGGRRQENRPGIEGTWMEPGVQCEACHGPGSVHVANPSAGHLTVDSSSSFCGQCHGDPADPQPLPAADGFIVGNRQWSEVLASPHADFACNYCHNPHTSAIYDPVNGLRNDCTSCHTTANMARHQNKVFVQGDYVEVLSCQSCHMPPAARNGSATVSGTTRIGDTRVHLMYVDVTVRDYQSMFTPDGGEVVRDGLGKAAVTVDLVCLRCHNGLGSAFTLDLRGAAAIAEGIHAAP